jgi:mRNA-degrading endonuclease RelE of RelBE toxin-antitoxin system
VRELDALRALERVRLLKEVDEQLSREPLAESRRKKVLHGLVPPWDQVGPVRQLRVGDFRVFYDVDEPNTTVIVRAVRRKQRHKTTEEIL